MEPRISVVTLGVEDLDRSVEFYRDVLGLPTQDGDGEIAFFETARGGTLTLPRRWRVSSVDSALE